MKNIKLFAVALAAFALLISINSNGQPKKQHNWHERMMSEKIAFITTELELTQEEAQAFWPVYNQITKEQEEKQLKVKTAHTALKKAIDEAGDAKEIDKLLDEYLAAKQANNTNSKEYADQYRKVLPGEKVAKLYLAEEKFRRMHIRNFKGGKGQGRHGNKPGSKK
jgi:Spy/CpxP family protein refolding chaperone